MEIGAKGARPLGARFGLFDAILRKEDTHRPGEGRPYGEVRHPVPALT